VQWQDSWDRLGPIGEYHRTTPPAADRATLVRTATLAVAEALARLGRALPIRVIAGDRSADLAGIPPEVRMLPAAEAVGRLPGLTTAAIGTARAGGLSLTVGRQVGLGAAAVSVGCVLGDEITVHVECAPDDPWRRSAAAVAEIVAEVLAELLADPTRSPADAAGCSPTWPGRSSRPAGSTRWASWLRRRWTATRGGRRWCTRAQR
jgi:hypothetical protein